jgi:putative endonuclease
MASVYILFSEKLNKFYVGACIDLERRFYEHNIGHSKFTSTGVPWKLVYRETHVDLPEAKRRESPDLQVLRGIKRIFLHEKGH